LERRFRGGEFSKHTDKLFLSGCLTFSVVLGCVGLVIAQYNGFQWRYDPTIVAADNTENQRNPLRDDCHLAASVVTLELLDEIKSKCILGSEDQVDTAIIGDSHASAIAFPVMTELQRFDVSSISITISGCLPFREYSTTQYNCAPANQILFDFLKSLNVKTIIMTGRYTNIFHRSGFDNGEGGVEYGEVPRPVYLNDEISNLEDEDSRGREFLTSGVNQWLSDGFNVVLVYPVPEAGWHVPKKVIKLKLDDQYDGFLGIKKQLYTERVKNVYASLDLLEGVKLRKLRPADYLCDRFVVEHCAHSFEDSIFYYDDDHLSIEGASLFSFDVAKLVDELRH